MVRPGRDLLRGTVEVDEAISGSKEEDFVGRLTIEKALIFIVVEEVGKGVGHIRPHRIPDASRAVLHGAIADAIEPSSAVRTDGLNA